MSSNEDRKTIIYESTWLDSSKSLKEGQVKAGEMLVCLKRKSVKYMEIRIPCICKKVRYEFTQLTTVHSVITTILSKEPSLAKVMYQYGLLVYHFSPESSFAEAPFRPISAEVKVGEIDSDQPEQYREGVFLDKKKKLADFKSIDLKHAQFVICSKEEYERQEYGAWIRVQTNWNYFFNHRRVKVKKMIRKGIPFWLRDSLWPLMLGAFQLMKVNEGIYLVKKKFRFPSLIFLRK